MMIACTRETKHARDSGFLKIPVKMKIFDPHLVSVHLLVRQQWCQWMRKAVATLVVREGTGV